MPYDLYVAPTKSGHYENYFNYLSSGSDEYEGVFLEAPSGLKGVLLILSRVRVAGTRPRAIHLLFGEKYLPVAFMLRLLGYDVTGIIYYIQHKRLSMLNYLVTRVALSFALILKIKFLSLEMPSTIPESAFYGVLLDVIDPHIPIEHNTEKQLTDEGVVRVLVAGHITERKLVLELMDSIRHLKRAVEIRFYLRIVGELEINYQATVLAAADVLRGNGVKVTIINERIPIEVLTQEIATADLVFAAYRDHYGSSGMVINAMALGCPVVFFSIGALNSFAELLPNCEQPTKEVDIADSIFRAITEPSLYRLDTDARATFIAERTSSRFAESFHSFIFK